MTKLITSYWTLAQALKINPSDPTVTTPPIPYDFPVMDSKHRIWDTMQLTDFNNQVTLINGWQVIFCLTVDYDTDAETRPLLDVWNNRNSSAYIAIYISKDGGEWQYKGRLLEKSADIRPYEWSGSMYLEDKSGEVLVVYTSVNDKQQIPSFSRGRIHISDDGVLTKSGFTKTTEIVHPDGYTEATPAQNVFAGFRDMKLFSDPITGRLFATVEIDGAWDRGSKEVESENLGWLPPEQAGHYPGNKFLTGGIGLYEITDLEKMTIKRLGVLLSAFGTCEQTERPMLSYDYDSGLYYLWTITHNDKFADGVKGVDGLYGFVSDDLFSGNFVPMNGGGLVAGCPESQPKSWYSGFPMLGARKFVSGFLDTIPHPTDANTFRIGGTLSPTWEIVIEGHTSYLTNVLGYGELPVIS